MAVDPGTTQSALVIYDQSTGDVLGYELHNNPAIEYSISCRPDSPLVIEMIGHYGTGMAVGKTVFHTCLWIGRFWKAHGQCDFMLRKKVATHMCGSARAKDSNILQAISDRYGGGDRRAAVGTKKAPGPLYGFRKDLWQALALAIAYSELGKEACEPIGS